ncbi:hypothetical protein IWQ60_009270 [Tieghemiomyces parasiticus]|uniref:RRM domain-containing protein n=1 Tax=Tieghemiomyces parasiticus TaxID=78921 RepID=A0A9W8DPV9_9FUNG|nr:hypothetical protein IWQ60_009270 [Tieghemiomyces parasiticus]
MKPSNPSTETASPIPVVSAEPVNTTAHSSVAAPISPQMDKSEASRAPNLMTTPLPVATAASVIDYMNQSDHPGDEYGDKPSPAASSSSSENYNGEGAGYSKIHREMGDRKEDRPIGRPLRGPVDEDRLTIHGTSRDRHEGPWQYDSSDRSGDSHRRRPHYEVHVSDSSRDYGERSQGIQTNYYRPHQPSMPGVRVVFGPYAEFNNGIIFNAFKHCGWIHKIDIRETDSIVYFRRPEDLKHALAMDGKLIRGYRVTVESLVPRCRDGDGDGDANDRLRGRGADWERPYASRPRERQDERSPYRGRAGHSRNEHSRSPSRQRSIAGSAVRLGTPPASTSVDRLIEDHVRWGSNRPPYCQIVTYRRVDKRYLEELSQEIRTPVALVNYSYVMDHVSSPDVRRYLFDKGVVCIMHLPKDVEETHEAKLYYRPAGHSSSRDTSIREYAPITVKKAVTIIRQTIKDRRSAKHQGGSSFKSTTNRQADHKSPVPQSARHTETHQPGLAASANSAAVAPVSASPTHPAAPPPTYPPLPGPPAGINPPNLNNLIGMLGLQALLQNPALLAQMMGGQTPALAPSANLLGALGPLLGGILGAPAAQQPPLGGSNNQAAATPYMQMVMGGTGIPASVPQQYPLQPQQPASAQATLLNQLLANPAALAQLQQAASIGSVPPTTAAVPRQPPPAAYPSHSHSTVSRPPPTSSTHAPQTSLSYLQNPSTTNSSRDAHRRQ